MATYIENFTNTTAARGEDLLTIAITGIVSLLLGSGFYILPLVVFLPLRWWVDDATHTKYERLNRKTSQREVLDVNTVFYEMEISVHRVLFWLVLVAYLAAIAVTEVGV